MCRLLAQVTLKPESAREFIADSEYSLIQQSRNKKGCLQRDGWGIGWNDAAGKANVVKSPQPIYKEAAKVVAAASKAVAPIVIAHVRAASNPRGVSRARLINELNTQPFMSGPWIFAHNGTLQIPLEVTKALGPLRRKLKSINDSEVYFFHLLKHIKKSSSVAQGVQKGLLELWDIWDSCKKRYPDLKAPYTALNALFTEGESLYAVCHAGSAGMAMFGACNPSQPWTRMSFSARQDRFLVASENADRGSWNLFNPPEVITVERRTGSIVASRQPLTGVPQIDFPKPVEEAVVS